MILLLPLYITGKKAEEKNLKYTTLELMTLLVAENDEFRIWVVFIVTAIFSVLGHLMLHHFDHKIKSFQDKSKVEASEMTELDMSLHTVMITNIDRDIHK